MMAPSESWRYSATKALDWATRPNGPPLPGGITLPSILAELDQNPITVSVLWVVDANGRMIGLDPHKDFARLTTERQARQQLAEELLSPPIRKSCSKPRAKLDPDPIAASTNAIFTTNSGSATGACCPI